MSYSPEIQVQKHREFFSSGQTQSLSFRMAALKQLKQVIEANKTRVLVALKSDLHKPELEGYYEFGVMAEIDYTLKHLKQWLKPQRVSTPLVSFPGKAEIHPEPLGVALILSAWNYPFTLTMTPLVGAIAAGNCAIIKPSEFAPATSEIIAQMIHDNFDQRYLSVIEGDATVSQEILKQKFDYIFFTGSARIGKLVMTAAAQHLTPVTLELGGKSPCIVDQDCDLECTARRIIWGKFLNAGQTCIAPDYLLVQREIKPRLIQQLIAQIKAFYGDDPEQSPDYARIVNEKQFNSLCEFLQEGTILCGGNTNPETRYIAPTLIDGISWNSLVMQGEIFGPILPILEYNEIEEAIAQINQHPKPLALYLFSRRSQLQQHILHHTSSGAIVFNDTVLHVNIPQLPFGGVGQSGMGSYHGKASFDTFTHYKSVLKRPFWLDLSLRYPPYEKNLNLLKKVL